MLYEEIKSRNIIAAIKPLLQQDVLELRLSDGKVVPFNLKNTWHTPWLHHRLSYRHNCYIWKDIIFENVIKSIWPPGQWFVPESCQGCYKVVARPQSVKQLFQLADLQYELNYASKCGIEIRPSVFGNYGGYFYNRGLEEGLACYKTVKRAVLDEIGDIPVILKRGCTEMEHGVGPSNEWSVSPAQKQFEDLVKHIFAMDIPVIGQMPHAQDYVKQLWIEEAYKLGDPTVYEFIDEPLYPGYVTYHEEAEKEILKQVKKGAK